jgi:hypothetical protein
VILILSLVLALIALLGVGYAVVFGAIATVDSLFLVLILLTMAGIFTLNALLEARQRGYLKFGKKQPETKAAPTGQKTS